MGTITIRVSDELKTESYSAIQKLGITPSELLRQTLQYVADNQKLPFKSTLLNSEDEELLKVARERLASPDPVDVDINTL